MNWKETQGRQVKQGDNNRGERRRSNHEKSISNSRHRARRPYTATIHAGESVPEYKEVREQGMEVEQDWILLGHFSLDYMG
jgi:hypothetical protein